REHGCIRLRAARRRVDSARRAVRRPGSPQRGRRARLAGARASLDRFLARHRTHGRLRARAGAVQRAAPRAAPGEVTDTPWRITLADVVLDERELGAVDEVLRGGWLSMGPVTERFEAEFSRYLGGGHAVAVTNGTAALHLAAAALGIGPGDEVICPTLTFVATAAAMLQTGAKVRFADSTSLDDFSLDPAEIDRLVTEQTKAVVVVHYGGFPVDMDAIHAAAAKHGLLVIEDA